ncbi:tRNA-specific adenosine deaminase [Planctomycetales bacterium]|nr:tRNA-specific adenosine deaminase [Planctomycetales bacterium]
MTSDRDDRDYFLEEQRLRLALTLAREAAEAGEAPVGAVIFHRGQLVGKAANQREQLQDPTAHAEIIAITQAAAALGSWRLDDCEMYVTLEPCAMCAGAIVLARLPRLVFGAFDPKAGACGSALEVINCPALNHHPVVLGGILANECGETLRDFFRAKRGRTKRVAIE